MKLASLMKLEAEPISYPQGTKEDCIRSPYPSPEVGGRCLREGIDEFYWNEIYVWYHLVYDGGNDLEIESASWGFEGTEPCWWEYVFENGSSMDFELFPFNLTKPQALKWAMEHGVIHEQPFALHITYPEADKTSYEYDEWDYSYEVSVVRIGEPRKGLRDFERVVGGISEYPTWKAKRDAERRKAQWASPMSRLLVSRTTVGDWQRPIAIVRLLTTLSDPDEPRLFRSVELAQGRSESGDWQEAMKDLRAECRKHRPELSKKGVLERCPTRLVERVF